MNYIKALEDAVDYLAEASAAQTWSTPGDVDLEKYGEDLIIVANFGDWWAVNGDLVFEGGPRTRTSTPGGWNDIRIPKSHAEIEYGGGRIPTTEEVGIEHVIDRAADGLGIPRDHRGLLAAARDVFKGRHDVTYTSVSGDATYYANKKALASNPASFKYVDAEPDPEFPQDSEPADDDIVTRDYKTWYQNGKVYARTPGASTSADEEKTIGILEAKMESQQFWPNLWLQGERGEMNLLAVTGRKGKRGKSSNPPPKSWGKMNHFAQQYVETALWSSTDDEDAPMDKNYTADDIAPATLRQMLQDAARFERENAQDIEAGGGDFGRAAHDFWLTRNRHGAGFWDGDWPEPQAARLTKAAHAFGEYSLYVGDDGKIHGSGA